MTNSNVSSPWFLPILLKASHLTLSLLLVILASASASRAQDPDEVVRTDVALVQLNVGVVDKDGHAVTSLSRNDFSVYEDGVRQSTRVLPPC